MNSLRDVREQSIETVCTTDRHGLSHVFYRGNFTYIRCVVFRFPLRYGYGATAAARRYGDTVALKEEKVFKVIVWCMRELLVSNPQRTVGRKRKKGTRDADGAWIGVQKLLLFNCKHFTYTILPDDVVRITCLV